jgi:hypothetical protein
MTKKSKCLFKDFDLWRSGFSRNAFIKIHDVEFENVTIEYLSVQGGIYSTTPALWTKLAYRSYKQIHYGKITRLFNQFLIN